MIKQVIILRKDLGMRKGKMVAQGAHASLAVLTARGFLSGPKIPDTHLVIPMSGWFREWLIDGPFTKICLGCGSEEELLALHEKAKADDLPCSLIKDAGKTEFGGVPTYTAVAIGPAPAERIDPITGELSLL